MKKYLFLIILPFLFFSCASIKISTIKNDNKKLYDISGYLVYCDIADIELRTNLEKEIVNCFLKIEKKAKESIVLFPPLRDYNTTEIYEKSKENELNAKLTITQINSSSATGYMYMYGMLVPVSSTNYTFDIIVQDLTDGEIILRSTLNTEGGSLKYIISNIAERLVTELQNEEIKETEYYFSKTSSIEK